MNILGIDIGGSTTKIVGFSEDMTLIEPMSVRATDPLTSVYGAFGKFLNTNSLELDDVEQVMITGVGSSYIDKPLYGRPCSHVGEFQCGVENLNIPEGTTLSALSAYFLISLISFRITS